MNAKKKNLALAGIAVLLVAVLAVAAVLYQKFSAEYAGENLGSTEEAQLAAQELLERDPGLKRPEHAPLLKQIHRLFEQHGDMFN